MKPINYIRLEHSHHNLIIQGVDDNGKVILNEINWDDFVAQHTAELKNQIEELRLQLKELRNAREQDEELAGYKQKELQLYIIDLEEKLTEQKSRFLEVMAELSENSQAGSVSSYRQALAFFLAGRLDEALEVLKEDWLWEFECQQAKQRVLRGNILFFQNCLEEAEYNMRRAVEIAPGLENFIILGHFYNNCNRCGQACSAYRSALSFCANDFEKAKVFSEIGKAHLKMNNLQTAEYYINKGYSLFIEYITGQCLQLPVVDCLKISCARADLAFSMRDFEVAEKIYHDTITSLEEFGEVEQLMDFKAWTYYNFAKMLEENGRREESLSMYAAAISLYESLSVKEPDLNKPYLAQAMRECAHLLSPECELRESYLLRAYRLTHDETIYHFWHKTLTADVLVSLCLMYEETCQKDMMQSYLTEARTLLEEIYEQNPDLYLPKLCYILDRQCMYDDKGGQSETMQRGVEVYERMSPELQEKWLNWGALFYFRIARQLEARMSAEAENYFARVLDLVGKAVRNDPECQEELVYMENYAVHYMQKKMSGIEMGFRLES